MLVLQRRRVTVGIFAGLDVSDKSTTICVVDGAGAVLERAVVASDPDVLAKWLAKHCPGLERVILETGPLSTFLYHGLVERDVPVLCICARHAKKALSARVNKSDTGDAECLAQLCRTGWFKQVHMKAGGTHIARAALKIRAQLVASRSAFANQLRGMLKLFGLRMGSATTPNKRRERLEALFTQRPDLKPVLHPLIESIEALEAQISKSGKLLAARAGADPVATKLMSVPGVGPVTALAFIASIEDPGLQSLRTRIEHCAPDLRIRARKAAMRLVKQKEEPKSIEGDYVAVTLEGREHTGQLVIPNHSMMSHRTDNGSAVASAIRSKVNRNSAHKAVKSQSKLSPKNRPLITGFEQDTDDPDGSIWLSQQDR